MISVVIPTYKNLVLCKQAATSVLKQKSCKFEIIITDDSPDKEIENWVNTLGSDLIRYYHNNPSKGAIDNWNYGISLAQGDAIVLLHHDESFASDNHLQKIEEGLHDYDVLVFNKKVLLGDKEKKERIPLWIKKLGFISMYPLFALNFIGPCACIAFKKSISVDFDNRLHWYVDIEWYYRLFKNAKTLKYINSPQIISHHGHEGQITNNINIKEVATIDTQIINEKYKSSAISFFLWIGNLINRIK